MAGFTGEKPSKVLLLRMHTASWFRKLYTFLARKQVKKMPADMGQAAVGTMAMASAALNFLGQVGDAKSTDWLCRCCTACERPILRPRHLTHSYQIVVNSNFTFTIKFQEV